MSNLHRISIAIIAKNAMKTIAGTLNSVTKFKEVVLLIDEESSDATEVMASQYSNVKIFRSRFTGFGEMKQKVVALTTNDWILSLDTDEVLSEELIHVLESINLEIDSVYCIKRNNCFKGRHIDACGWDNDFPIRLFNKTKTNFNDQKVHESIISYGMQTKKINQAIIHYSYESEIQLKEKAIKYARLFKEQNRNKSQLPTIFIYLKTASRFVRDFLFKKGFLYGSDGFVISKYNALGVYWKYQKGDFL